MALVDPSVADPSQAQYDELEPCDECGQVLGRNPHTGVSVGNGHKWGCSAG